MLEFLHDGGADLLGGLLFVALFVTIVPYMLKRSIKVAPLTGRLWALKPNTWYVLADNMGRFRVAERDEEHFIFEWLACVPQPSSKITYEAFLVDTTSPAIRVYTIETEVRPDGTIAEPALKGLRRTRKTTPEEVMEYLCRVVNGYELEP